MSSKKLGLPSAVAICVGLIVASSCLLQLGSGIGLAGKWFILSMAIVLVLNFCLVLSFGELHALMPKVDGGLGQYTKAGLGPAVSIVANSSAYVIVNVLAGSVEIAMCGQVVSETFLPMVPSPVMSVLILVVLAFVNYRGIDMFSKIQNLVVSLLLLSLIGMGVISFFRLGTGTPVDAAAQTVPAIGSFSGALSLSAMAFWLFIGIEFVIPVANQLKNPKRDVMLAMVIGLVLLFGIQTVLGTGMANYVTYEELASSNLPHIIFARNLLGRTGEVWMAIVTILASISTANTLLSSVPRILSGMAENDMMPSVFAKKNKFGTPVGGIYLIAGGIVALILTGYTASAGLGNLLLAASCFWLTSYILVNLTVLALRRRYPNHPARNKRLTFFGIPQVLGIFGNLYMIWNIAEGDARVMIFKLFFSLMALLVLFAVVWVKLIKKQRLFAAADIDDINQRAQNDTAVTNAA